MAHTAGIVATLQVRPASAAKANLPVAHGAAFARVLGGLAVSLPVAPAAVRPGLRAAGDLPARQAAGVGAPVGFRVDAAPLPAADVALPGLAQAATSHTTPAARKPVVQGAAPIVADATPRQPAVVPVVAWVAPVVQALPQMAASPSILGGTPAAASVQAPEPGGGSGTQRVAQVSTPVIQAAVRAALPQGGAPVPGGQAAPAHGAAEVRHALPQVGAQQLQSAVVVAPLGKPVLQPAALPGDRPGGAASPPVSGSAMRAAGASGSGAVPAVRSEAAAGASPVAAVRGEAVADRAGSEVLPRVAVPAGVPHAEKSAAAAAEAVPLALAPQLTPVLAHDQTVGVASAAPDLVASVVAAPLDRIPLSPLPADRSSTPIQASGSAPAPAAEELRTVAVRPEDPSVALASAGTPPRGGSPAPASGRQDPPPAAQLAIPAMANAAPATPALATAPAGPDVPPLGVTRSALPQATPRHATPQLAAHAAGRATLPVAAVTEAVPAAAETVAAVPAVAAVGSAALGGVLPDAALAPSAATSAATSAAIKPADARAKPADAASEAPPPVPAGALAAILAPDGLAPPIVALPGPLTAPAAAATGPQAAVHATAQDAPASATAPAGRRQAGLTKTTSSDTPQTAQANQTPATGHTPAPAATQAQPAQGEAGAAVILADPGIVAAGAVAPQAATAATPASDPANAATPQAAQAAVPPAAQFGHAVAAMHVGADGTSHVTIKLDPIELGQVQIRISRAADGTASVNVAVERPETLATLQGDLGHLHQALDRAGVADQRSVTFHLAPTATDAGSGSAAGSFSGGTPQGGFQHGARQERQPSSPAGATTPGGALDQLPSSAAPWRRPGAQASGVNITA